MSEMQGVWMQQDVVVGTVDIDAHALRSGIWRLLAGGLAAAPTQQWLDQLRGIQPDNSVHDPLGWHALQSAAQKTSVTELRDEHFELFIGVGRGELVPFGSWYLTGFLMEKPLALLRRDLGELGFERADTVRESEDHIGFLSELMASLIDADAEDISRQRQFFNSHVGPWANTFFDDLSGAKAARFYRQLGVFGGAFLRLEQQHLDMPV